MLNPIKFRMESESGPVEGETTGLDYAAYEDTFDRSFWQDFFGGRYKCQVWIVWHALTRTGQTTQTFDEFLASSPQFESDKDGAALEVDPVVPLEETTTSTS